MKDCPSVKVQAVEGAEAGPEVLFNGQVGNLECVPMINRDARINRPPDDGLPTPR